MRVTPLYLLLAACAAHDPAMAQKLDSLQAQVAANQHALEALRQDLQRPPEPPHDNTAELQREIAELDKKIDHLVIAANARPAYTPPRRPEPDRAKTYAIKVTGYPSVGPADAKVTMVWVHDYADPYSNKSRPVVDDLRRKYGTELRVVYRDLVVHPQVATASALAACAAHKQRAFVKFDDILWDKGYGQRMFDTDLPSNSPSVPPTKCWDDAAGCPIMIGFAQELGLDTRRFQADMKACKPAVDADMAELQTFGVGATPTWFVNGRFMSGAMPPANFEALIDEELAKANASHVPKAQYYKREVLDKGLTKLEPGS